MEREAHIKSNYIRAQGMDHKSQVFHLHQNSKRSRPRIQGRPAQKVRFVNIVLACYLLSAAIIMCDNFVLSPGFVCIVLYSFY